MVQQCHEQVENNTSCVQFCTIKIHSCWSELIIAMFVVIILHANFSVHVQPNLHLFQRVGLKQEGGINPHSKWDHKHGYMIIVGEGFPGQSAGKSIIVRGHVKSVNYKRLAIFSNWIPEVPTMACHCDVSMHLKLCTVEPRLTDTPEKRTPTI